MSCVNTVLVSYEKCPLVISLSSYVVFTHNMLIVCDNSIITSRVLLIFPVHWEKHVANRKFNGSLISPYILLSSAQFFSSDNEEKVSADQCWIDMQLLFY